MTKLYLILFETGSTALVVKRETLMHQETWLAPGHNIVKLHTWYHVNRIYKCFSLGAFSRSVINEVLLLAKSCPSTHETAPTEHPKEIGPFWGTVGICLDPTYPVFTHLAAASCPSWAVGVSACLFKPRLVLLGKTKQHTYLSGHWKLFLSFRPARCPGGIRVGRVSRWFGSFENRLWAGSVRLARS